ncbi:AhpC/TSA family protein [Cobetia sp. cqz5-12]|nr:AhpC/TSA family protein [Cobetia sp. cqz5-12]
MKSLKEQTEAKVEAGRQAKPDFMKNVDEIIENAKALQQGANALSVGEKAPGFALPDAAGQSVSLEELLESGPVVVTFYRGDWCPYCSLQLRALNERLDDIRAHGAQLVAISPQVPDDSLSATEIDEMQFHVLSDQDAEVASRYGVAWKVPDYLMEHMRVDRELDLDAINNGDGSVLPIPATFVIAQDRTVSWRYVDVDYRIRSEPEDIVNALKELA